MPDTQVGAGFFVGVVAIILTLLVTAVGLIAWVTPKARRLGKFFDAWEGYDDPATGRKVPGVPERLTAVEEAQRETGLVVARVEAGVTEAASAAVTANKKADHLSEQIVEVKAQLGEVADATHALAAEQTQIRSAVEGLRHGTDATDNEQGSTT